MQYLFLAIFAVPFVYLNYKITSSDIQNKTIPNKFLGYLLLLLPFWYIFLFFFFPNISFLSFFGQIFLSLFISFILFHFGVWSAGDTKYLLVLALFIPHIGIVSFIGNLGVLTLFYLFLYFIWFYFGKCIFYKGYANSLYGNIKNDLRDKWEVYKDNKGGKPTFIAFKWLVTFLIIFVSIRLARIYVFASFFEGGNRIEFLKEILEKYHFYLVFLALGIFIGMLYVFRLFFKYTRKFLLEKLKILPSFVGKIIFGLLFFFLLSFIIYEFLEDPEEIQLYLFRIFTIYISLYLLFKILWYSYKLTFSTSETNFIDIKDLQVGDMVDKGYLQKIFGTQKSLGYKPNRKAKKNPDFFYIEPETYFKELRNPIDTEAKNTLQKAYKVVNNYHQKQKTPNYSQTRSIKIINTFSFGPYIFFGFLFTFLFGNSFFSIFLQKIIAFIRFGFGG